MATKYFHVYPRYTPGSPAMVPEETARRVAKEEKNSYDHCLSGIYGEEDKEKAEKMGVSGIAYSTKEVKDTIEVEDLITGDISYRLSPEDRKKESDSMRKVMNLLCKAMLECKDADLRASIDDLAKDAKRRLGKLLKN